ncbi:MAG: glycosyltransferase [Candidatus Omnitrophica bacterium]|jgi:trehalose synthase|nr:glycosyltransferase [Candidatus Omnitrophota bacterium]
MVRSIGDYINVVGEEKISEIYKKVNKLYGKRVANVNATFLGGGVAEILGRMVPLMNEVGLDAEWRTIHGSPAFFDVTKSFHNALQGGPIELNELKKSLYLDINQEYASFTHLNHYNCLIVHDPQPLPLIKFYRKQQPWIWRCHIDITNPNPELWDFVKQFIIRYDVMIVSSEKYKKPDLPVPQRIICPAIDPLSLKNRELSEEEIMKYIKECNIPTDKPIITQVSRMDPWKDPEGVLEVFKLVKEKVDCRLLFCYNLATDDPEGIKIFERVFNKAKEFKEKGEVLFIVGNNELLVNAIQRFSTLIIQKSVREGFGLTVTEALWKAKPVVAGNVGGIPSQIIDGKTGFLVDPYDYKACAEKIIRILKEPKLGEEIGKKAKEFVREKFLTTRLISDYLDLLGDLLR